MKARWIVVAMVYGFFTAFARKGDDFAWIFPILMLLAAWISVRVLIRQEGGGKLVLAWGLLAMAIAYANTRTGLLFFQDAIGPSVAGLPVAWPLLLLPIMAFATVLAEHAHVQPWKRALHGACVSLGSALLIIPVAFSLGLWGYRFNGVYYHTPWMQFAIWALIGVLAVTVADMVPRKYALHPQTMDGAHILIAFMIGAALGYQLALASLLGLGLLFFIQRSKNHL